MIKNGEIIETANIEEAKKIETDSHYQFEVNNSKLAQAVLTKEIEIKDQKTFTLTMSKEEAPEIIETLVNKGIKIYEVKEEKLTLEDAFLKKTGGNQIV